jgi:hypothetical protein
MRSVHPENQPDWTKQITLTVNFVKSIIAKDRRFRRNSAGLSLLLRQETNAFPKGEQTQNDGCPLAAATLQSADFQTGGNIDETRSI